MLEDKSGADKSDAENEAVCYSSMIYSIFSIKKKWGRRMLIKKICKSVCLAATVLLMMSGTVDAQPLDESEYYCSNTVQATKVKYKNIPDDWWSAFVLKEFDKAVPAPGSDWTQEMQNPLFMAEWLDKATAKGWVVKRGPKDAAVGAIVIVEHFQDHTANAGVVKEVYDWGIVTEQVINDQGQRGHVRVVTYAWMDFFKNEKQAFLGYIWPIRKIDYDRAPQEFEAGRFTKADEKKYKGWRSSWGPTWVLKEFDRNAPGNGADWGGKIEKWLDNAVQMGWLVSRDATNVKEGAILIRIATADKWWVQIVRKVNADGITVESLGYPIQRIVREELKFSELPQKNFSGYILPEK